MNTAKLDDLQHYVNKYDPDAICLTETWFTTARQNNTSIPGYTAYTANTKQRVGGGVAIFLRSSINGKNSGTQDNAYFLSYLFENIPS